MIQGIIFDFNGTLFWDSILHDIAWIKFAAQNNLRVPTKKEMRIHIHGRGNTDIMNYVFNKKLKAEEINRYTQEKERIYRKEVLSQKADHTLAPGVEELLDFLNRINLPITIATSSEKNNVDFFFEHLQLNRWFDIGKVVFDNGKFPLKPAPDIFLMAADRINVPISNCLIVEDSPAGIQAARNAGAQCVVFIKNNSPAETNDIENLIDYKVENLADIINVMNEA